MSVSYRDGEAYCEATDQTITLRCDVHGAVTCRGPENIRKYRRKCSFNTHYLCALVVAAKAMRERMRERLASRRRSLKRGRR